jgi:hypothetical protein
VLPDIRWHCAPSRHFLFDLLALCLIARSARCVSRSDGRFVRRRSQTIKRVCSLPLTTAPRETRRSLARPSLKGVFDESAVSGSGKIGCPEQVRVVRSDDGVKTVTDGGRVEYRTGRGRERLPAVLTVTHHKASAASMAEKDSGPVARYDASRSRAISVDLHRGQGRVTNCRPSDMGWVETP